MHHHGCRFRRRKQRSRQKDGMSPAPRRSCLSRAFGQLFCLRLRPTRYNAFHEEHGRTRERGEPKPRSRVAHTGRPFGARRVSAKLEIDRRNSPPRVRNARSVTFAPAMPVHAAIAGVGIGHYSRRGRQGKSEDRFPAARSGRRRWATREQRLRTCV